MGHANREIERKFVVTGKSLIEVSNAVAKSLRREFRELVTDESSDIYWKAGRGAKADFIRLRMMPDGTGQLTVKWTDRGSTTNRIEIDVVVPDPVQCQKFLTQVHGKPEGSISKEYHVYLIDKMDTNVSVYQVDGDKRVFLEVEARTLERVSRLCKQVGTAIKMEREKRSLYQIFVKGQV